MLPGIKVETLREYLTRINESDLLQRRRSVEHYYIITCGKYYWGDKFDDIGWHSLEDGLWGCCNLKKGERLGIAKRIKRYPKGYVVKPEFVEEVIW